MNIAERILRAVDLDNMAVRLRAVAGKLAAQNDPDARIVNKAANIMYLLAGISGLGDEIAALFRGNKTGTAP